MVTAGEWMEIVLITKRRGLGKGGTCLYGEVANVAACKQVRDVGQHGCGWDVWVEPAFSGRRDH